MYKTGSWVDTKSKTSIKACDNSPYDEYAKSTKRIRNPTKSVAEEHMKLNEEISNSNKEAKFNLKKRQVYDPRKAIETAKKAKYC